jgi:hypothetical protein
LIPSSFWIHKYLRRTRKPEILCTWYLERHPSSGGMERGLHYRSRERHPSTMGWLVLIGILSFGRILGSSILVVQKQPTEAEPNTAYISYACIIASKIKV